MNKTDACVKLREMHPTLSQYDEQLQHYKNYWSDRIATIEEQVVTSCVMLVKISVSYSENTHQNFTIFFSSRLEMKQLKQAALEHIKEWIRQLGATWLASTVEKIKKVENLTESLRQMNVDGSLDIDIELLIMEVQESWYRLGHYSIQVTWQPFLFINVQS